MNLTDEQLEVVKHDYKKNRRLIIEATAGCYSGDTEFFNGTKWKKISEYKVGDKVTQFDPVTRLNKLVEPIDYIKKEINGVFRRYKNNFIDMILSEEHNVVVFHMDRFFKVMEEDFYSKMKYNLDNYIPIYFDDEHFERGFKEESSFGLSRIDTIETIEFVPSEDGFKYCFEVQSGMLVMRRNGKIFISSNSGKSSTLYHVCKKNSRMKSVYCVFNTSMKEEAEKKFAPLSNVKVMSLFGLAYAKEGGKYKHRLVGNYKIHDLIDDLHNNNILKIEMGNKLDMNLAYLMKEVYESYLMSPEHDLRKWCEDYELEDYFELIFETLTKLINMAKQPKSTIKVTHNFYMKMWAMSNPQLPYDLILVDECLTENHIVNIGYGIWKSIKYICENYDEGKSSWRVESYNEKDRRFEFKNVLGVKISKDRDVYRVKLSNGQEIECTANHPILTKRGYVELKSLVVFEDEVRCGNMHQYASYFKVMDIEYIGKRDVYDIKVEDNHNFVTKIYGDRASVVVHNCQDLSDIFISILDKQKARIIAVGDSSQQIYTFAGAQNALVKLNNDEARVLNLTNSFRVGHQISKIVTAVYRRFGFKNFNMVGVNENQTVVPELDLYEKHAIICRTRAKLFESAMKAVDQGRKIHFIGGFKSYDFQKVLNAFYFWSRGDKPNPMYDSTFVPFKSWRDVDELLEQQKNNPRLKVDTELKFLSGMIKTYNVKIPLYHKQIKESEVEEYEADIILTTAHKSKGLEFECGMYLQDDFIPLQDALEGLYKAEPKDREYYLESIKEELNIWYVAFTRAKGKSVVSKDTIKFLKNMKNVNSESVRKQSEAESKAKQEGLNVVRNVVSKNIKDFGNSMNNFDRDILTGED